ncbi:MAG: hypothetical protein IMF11_20910 [Proteobacteria bacterium]|nr:hypothetical protein [Pseudomonadota bacterium]
MVWNKRPGITGRLSLGQEFYKTIKEILAIIIVEEYLATLYPSDNDVMQDTGSAASPFTGLRPRNRAFFYTPR